MEDAKERTNCAKGHFATMYDHGVAEGGFFTIDNTLCAGDADYTEWGWDKSNTPKNTSEEEHLAGYEVSEDPSKGAESQNKLCPVCFHNHPPPYDSISPNHLD